MKRTTSQRKNEHIGIVLHEQVEYQKTRTLFEQVTLLHEALPDLALDEIDTSVDVLGRRLRVPLIIAGMTGGSPEAGEINRRLASIAQARSIGFGLGSQRAMVQDPALASTYCVREVAPDVLVLGNIGVVQAREMPTDAVHEMLQAVGADAVCVHMNPAMELVQPEGDQDFRQGLNTFARLVAGLPLPVVAKETGCGISLKTARRLNEAGVRHVDVSGAGGTSWVAVEMHRAEQTRSLGELFREWGIPTAASVVMARMAGMHTVIATGGIRTGLDVARAIALGASGCGVARSVLQALDAGGESEAHAMLERMERELRTAMLLTGSRDIAGLRRAQLMFGPDLTRWIDLATAQYASD